MLKINHNEFEKIIKHYYKTKLSLMVLGRMGIGKSFAVRDTAIQIAKEKNKEFVDWNRLNKQDRQKVYETPEKYFVLLDIRLSEYDTSDLKGLPNFMSDNQAIEWRVPFWAKLLEKESSDGILFFDEMNLAPPLVIASCYKILYDRVVNEGKVSDNWLIMGAGNVEEDRANTFELPSPVRDRAGEVELTGSQIEEWTDWAVKNKIDSRIIAYLNFQPSKMWKVDFNDKQKFTTYRGWERTSKLIAGMNDKEDLRLVCCSSIGEGIASEFLSFIELQSKINLEDLIKYPERIKGISQEDVSVKYLLITAMADRYSDNHKNPIKFEEIMKVAKVLDEIKNAEFVALLWRLCSQYNKDRFRKDWMSCKEQNFIEKYFKYLV